MDISEVSKITGLPPSAIRFYEEKGLIVSIGRSGLRRVFHSNVIERLSLISLGQRVGFSLKELSIMFSTKGKINRSMLIAKADELDKKIKELSSMSKGLRHAAVCNAPNHFECPKFLRLLRIAGRKKSRHTKKAEKHSKQ